MYEPRNDSSDRPGPCLDPEILGALVDGGLDSDERREAREHLSHCSDCAATFSEVLLISEEMAAMPASSEDAPEPAAVPAPESRGWTPMAIDGGAGQEPEVPSSRPREIRRNRRRGWATAAALAAGLAAAALTWFMVRPVGPFDSKPFIARWASVGFQSIGEIVSPVRFFPIFRSPGEGGRPEGAEAVQVAALFTHLEYLVAREEVGLARETLRDLDSRVDLPGLDTTLASMAESLERGVLPTAEEVAEASSLLDVMLLQSPNVELGRWAEIVRIATVFEKDVNVLRNRGLRRTLDRLVRESEAEADLGLDDLPPSTAEPLARLQELFADGVSEEELPAIREQVEELLRA